MRTYNETWDYTLTGNSLPYAINNGSPYTAAGSLHLPVGEFVNKDFQGYYDFQGQNYDGNYALTFDLDMSSAAVDLMFIILVYGGSSSFPAIQRSASGVLLGWSSYTAGLGSSSGNGAGVDIDFNGQEVAEVGTYQVMYLRRIVDSNNSEIAMHVRAPSGATFVSGWNPVGDSTKHNQIGSNTSGSGEWLVGTMAVQDQLTSLEADDLRANGPVPTCANPVFAPAAGSFDFSVDVEITCATPSAVIYYTLDGSDPTPTSASYSAPIHLTANTTIKAYAVLVDFVDSKIVTTPYVVVANPTCATPTAEFSVESETHTTNVTLACASASATIYYTIDGSDPTISSAEYTAPFNIAATAQVRAFAVKALYIDSNIVSLNYVLPARARKYVEAWNYELGFSSVPYSMIGSGEHFNYGRCEFPATSSFINKYVTNVDQAYRGNTALKFLLDTYAAGTNMIFTVLRYSSTAYSPAIERTATGIKLGWVSHTWYNEHVELASGQGSTVDGDFTGTEINEVGKYTIVYLMKPISSSESEIAMQVTTPSGLRYTTGWAVSYDPYLLNQIGSTNNGGQGNWSIGPISVLDGLTVGELEERLTATFCAPPSIAPPRGINKNQAIIEITGPGSGATTRFTTNGSMPSLSSPAYTVPVMIETDTTIAAIATHASIGDSAIDVSSYVISFGGAIKRIEPWVENGAWQFSGRRTMSGGTLTIDTNVTGIVSSKMYTRDMFSPLCSIGREEKYQCLELDITTTGSFRFGAHTASPEFSSNVRLIEFVRNGGQINFFIRGTTATLITGFDGSLSVSGSGLKLRAAWNEILGMFRFGIWDAAGATLIADTGWLPGGNVAIPDRNVMRNNIDGANGAGSTGLSSHFWQTDLRGGAGSTVALIALDGVLTVAPYSTFVNCGIAHANDFIENGNVELVPDPADPVIAVSSQPNGVKLVTITPDSHSRIIATINEGAYVADKYELVINNRSVVGTLGTPVSMVVADPSVLRAVSYNREISQMITQYVGPTTVVPIPEIAPRSGSIDTGTAMQVKISCTDANAQIRYTLDGSEPTESSDLYTGPLFLRASTQVAAKAFIGATSSVTKYARFWEVLHASDGSAWSILTGYNVLCSPIDNVCSQRFWNVTNNATFDAPNNSVTVNDAAGDGVTLRSDVLPAFCGVAVFNEYGEYEGVFVGFTIAGDFRLKMPGVSRHLARVGNYFGIVPDVATAPTYDANSATYMRVTVKFARGLLVNIIVRGYDAIDSLVVEQLLTAEPTVIGVDELTTLSFTGEGIAAYTVQQIQAMVVTGGEPAQSYPWVMPGTIEISGPSNMNFAGATVTVTPGIVGQAITSLYATSPGEAFNVVPYNSTTDASFDPLPVDIVGRVMIVSSVASSSSLFRIASKIGHGSKICTEYGSWNIKRSLSDVYFDWTSLLRAYTYLDVKLRVNGMTGDVYGDPTEATMRAPVLTNELLHRFREHQFDFPYDTFDNGNAWFRFRRQTATEAGRTDNSIFCGWDTDRAAINDVVLVTDVTESCVSSRLCEYIKNNTTPISYVQLFNTSTWTPVALSIPIYISAFGRPVWHCGRKIAAGRMLLRTMLMPETELNAPIFDTGWVDCGPTPAQLPRPRIIMRQRRVQENNGHNEVTSAGFVRGYAGLTASELDNCFDYGTPTPPAAPVLTDNNDVPVENYAVGSYPESNGMVPLKWSPAQNPNAAALYYKAGDQVLYKRSSNLTPMSSSLDEGVLTVDNAATIIALPSISFLNAINVNEPVAMIDGSFAYDGRSPVRMIEFSHQTTDYATINASIPRHVYVQFDKAQLPAIPMFGSAPTFWKMIFSDGYEYTVKATVSDDIERVLDPGTYTVKFARYGSDGESRSLGETIPHSFTVSDRLSLAVAAPSSVTPGVQATFTAVATGGNNVSYLWTFNDDFTATTSVVNRTFTKPGRYAWTVRSIDETGDAAQTSGQFIVVFPGSTPLSGQTTRAQETRVS
jgi:hypothetical protein